MAEINMGWFGKLRGVKEDKPWWKRKRVYRPGWWKDVPGYQGEGKPFKLFRSLGVSHIDELSKVWGRNWGAQGEIGKLKSVIVSRPASQEVSQEKEDLPEFFQLYHSKDERGRVHMGDLKKMQEQHDKFVEVLKDEVEEVIEWDMPDDLPCAYDTSTVMLTATRCPIVINGGVLMCRLGTTYCRGWEVLYQRVFAELGVPILYAIHGNGILDAGNVIFLDSKHVCLGNTYWSNMDGINQAIYMMKRTGVEEAHIVYFSCNPDLPWPAFGTMHLDCAFGVADLGLGIEYSLPFETVEYLQNKGFNLIDVPAEEQRKGACNIVALEPGKVIIASGCDKTSRALRGEGVDVVEVDLSETVKYGAGPHCKTLPLIREPDPSIEELKRTGSLMIPR